MNEELSGWKLVVGHVFREPVFSKLLCVMIGDEVQITGLALVTFVFAAPGFMSPASRGMLLTGMIILYLFPGNFSWCVGVRLWRTVKGNSEGWSKSTSAIPISLYFIFLSLQFCIYVPLTPLGGFLGTQSEPIQHPVRTIQIPRKIPAHLRKQATEIIDQVPNQQQAVLGQFFWWWLWWFQNNAFHYSEPVFLLSPISMGSDADMEDYGFEYSEEEPEEQDVDVENQYYNSKGLVEIDPEGAFAGFVEVVHMEPENAEWEQGRSKDDVECLAARLKKLSMGENAEWEQGRSRDDVECDATRLKKINVADTIQCMEVSIVPPYVEVLSFVIFTMPDVRYLDGDWFWKIVILTFHSITQNILMVSSQEHDFFFWHEKLEPELLLDLKLLSRTLGSLLADFQNDRLLVSLMLMA